MKHLLILLLFPAWIFSQSQTYNNDAQIRFNLGLEKKINKRFSITLNQQDRWNKNASQFYRASYDLGINYKINKYIRVRADYVFIQKRNKYDYFYNRNWYYVGLFLKKDFGRWGIVDRNLLQLRTGNINTEETYIRRYYYRNKLTIKYELTKRYEIYAAEEVYIPVNSPQATGIDRTRSYLGLSIITFRGQSIDLYFMYQAYLQNDNWFDQKNKYPNNPLKRYYVYGINYHIAF
jgi:hypothetical protein